MTVETFNTLLAPNLGSVKMLVRSRVRIEHADDIVQQAVLRAFSRRDQLREETKFKSWLWSIAINEVRMFLRGSRHNVSLEEVPHRQFVDNAPSPLARYEQRERERRLRAGMARLREHDRTAIRLVDLNGMSNPEAALKMGVSKAAFKSTLFRARQRLGMAVQRAA